MQVYANKRITIRKRYVPTEKSDAPPQDNKQNRTDEQAYARICALLASGHSVRQVQRDGTTVSIVDEKRARNTGSLFETSFSGPLKEMAHCLAAAYYWYDARCVEPPPAYRFYNSETRQRVLNDIQKWLPLRNAVGDLLSTTGYQPVVLEGLYDLRRCAPMKVGVMVYAGITDKRSLKIGAGMGFRALFNTCEYIRVFGMSFAEALKQA